MMNNLNVKTLSLIFKYLNLRDLINCSQVCQKFKELINPQKLFLCYGTKFLLKKKCTNETLIQDQKTSLEPFEIFDNSVSNIFTVEFLKNIETFIYYGKGYYVPSDSFNFYSFPFLKYLEIMDSSFCLSITAIFRRFLYEKKLDSKTQWKFFSPTIKTLIMEYSDFSMFLLGLPNLENVQINQFSNAFKNLIDFDNEFKIESTKWKSIVIKKDELFDSVFLDEDIFEFLMNKCNYLKSIYAIINSVDHLNKLLNNRKLRHICLKFYHDRHSMPIEYYKPIISKYKTYLENDCNLCINNFPIRSLYDFDQLIKDINLRKPIDEVFESCFEFDQKTKFLLINDLSGIKYFKKYPVVDDVKQITIVDEDINAKIDLNDFFKYLPNTLKSLSITSINTIDQEVIDLIPEYFPNLDELIFDIEKSRKYNSDFIFNLKYLYKLWLKNFILNFEEFVRSIGKNYFLKDINFFVDENNLEEVKKIFLDSFEKKELPFIYSLILNRKFFIFNNSLKSDEENDDENL